MSVPASGMIATTLASLEGGEGWAVGSGVVLDAYGIDAVPGDLDVFVPTREALMVNAQRLISECGGKLDNGKPDGRMSRIYRRWQRRGINFHTNSLRVDMPQGFQINLVWKLADNVPLMTMAAVLESFDFGELGIGYDLKTGKFREMRPYFFPGGEPPWLDMGLIDSRLEAVEMGAFTSYTGIKMVARWKKYSMDYGLPMTLAAEQMCDGLQVAADYSRTRTDFDHQIRAVLYDRLIEAIIVRDADTIDEVDAALDRRDSLDIIMESIS